MASSCIIYCMVLSCISQRTVSPGHCLPLLEIEIIISPLFSMKLRIVTNRYFSSIAEFSFVKEIGVGSFGSVKLALHLQTNKCYAVKVVNIGEGHSDNQLLLLEREINLHSAVDHPHIVKLWDTLIEHNVVYMIMELAQNGTLFAYQNRTQVISQAEAFKFFSQTLSAVRYLHASDIMHRDLKPENILLDNAFNVKICDLGWATDKIQLKRKTFCGTYEYMAPEMVFEKEYNYTIDTWALGILLYELLHNFAPFSAKSLDEMKEKVKLGHYQLGSNFCKELKSLIIDILQFDPQLRPSMAKICEHPWMQKMRREIRGEIIKIKGELEGGTSNRAKVSKEKGSLRNAGKLHRRFDSLVNETPKNEQSAKQGRNALQKLVTEGKEKGKKKCKTQGEESMEKLFTESMKISGDNRIKWKKEKQNKSQAKLTELSKTTLGLKNVECSASNIKLRRIADKLSEMTKTPLQKKKGRFRLQKEEG